MFLTRKELRRTNWLTALYLISGVLFLIAAAAFPYLNELDWLFTFIGVLSLVFGIVYGPVSRYTDGKGNLITSANKLVYRQLRPAEFIRLYIQKRDCPDNVVIKPDFDLLLMLSVAYDSLGDREHALEALDQMIFIAPEKKKPYARLLKASLLYAEDRVEEAEQLYREAQKGKMGIMAKSTAELLLKTDRAMALGDYAPAEVFYKQMLAQSFPKHPPLSVLIAHFTLGKICSLTDRPGEAREHLTYCLENGGETAIKAKAADLLNGLEPA